MSRVTCRHGTIPRTHLREARGALDSEDLGDRGAPEVGLHQQRPVTAEGQGDGGVDAVDGLSLLQRGAGDHEGLDSLFLVEEDDISAQ